MLRSLLHQALDTDNMGGGYACFKRGASSFGYDMTRRVCARMDDRPSPKWPSPESWLTPNSNRFSDVGKGPLLQCDWTLHLLLFPELTR